MRDRKKRNIIIGSLCCLLVFMGIVYALLNQNLSIVSSQEMLGEWDIRITNIVSKNEIGKAKNVSYSFTNTSANFEAELWMPGDSIEYEVTIENKGNISGKLQSIVPSTINKVESIKFSHTEVPNVLAPGEVKTFIVKVEVPNEAISVPTDEKIKYSLDVTYVQYDGKSEVVKVSDSTDESCFMVNQAGLLLAYNYKCGTDNVVVPKEVNGVTITGIYISAFNPSFGVINANNAYFWDEDSKNDAIASEEYKDKEWDKIEKVIFNGDIIQTVADYKTYPSFTLSSYKLFVENEKLKISSATGDDVNLYISDGSDHPTIYAPTNTETYELLMSECFSKKVEEAYAASVLDNESTEFCSIAYLGPSSIILLPNSYGTEVLVNYANLEDFDVSVPFFNILDLSQATGITQSVAWESGRANTIIMPPNLYNIAYGTGLYGYKNTIFPNNTTTKFAANVGFASETGVFEVPKSFEIIEYADVAENIEKIILHSDIKYFKFSGTKNLKSIVIKSKNEILGLKDGDKVHVGYAWNGDTREDIYATVSYEK